jgi:hypothetical protein
MTTFFRYHRDLRQLTLLTLLLPLLTGCAPKASHPGDQPYTRELSMQTSAELASAGEEILLGSASGMLLLLAAGLAGGWLWRRKSAGSSSPSARGAAAVQVGQQHTTLFPLLCQLGNDGNGFLEAGMPGRGQRQFLQLFWYLVSRGLIDQYLLGKAYLGLLMCEAHNPNGSLTTLLEGPVETFRGPLEPIGPMRGAAAHVFKNNMLSEQDTKLYQSLLDYAAQRGPLPTETMSPWDLSLAQAEQFPVLHIPTSCVAAVLDPKNPPPMPEEMAGQELVIPIPGLPPE